MTAEKKAATSCKATALKTLDSSVYPEPDDASRRISKRWADVPIKYQKLYERCMTATASPREAIKMQCLECWAWVRTETELCDNYSCPLYRYNPYLKAPEVADSGSSGSQEPSNEGEG